MVSTREVFSVEFVRGNSADVQSTLPDQMDSHGCLFCHQAAMMTNWCLEEVTSLKADPPSVENPQFHVLLHVLNLAFALQRS